MPNYGPWFETFKFILMMILFLVWVFLPVTVGRMARHLKKISEDQTRLLHVLDYMKKMSDDQVKIAKITDCIAAIQAHAHNVEYK